jgi:Autotransporter beta-domain
MAEEEHPPAEVAYVTYFPTNTFYLNGVAVIDGGNNDSRRHVVIPSMPSIIPGVAAAPSVDRIATGSVGSRVAGFTVAGGYPFPFGALVVTPIARFLYEPTGVDAFGGVRRVQTYNSAVPRLTRFVVPRHRWAVHGRHLVRSNLSRLVSVGTAIQPGNTARQYSRLGCVQ